MPAVDDFTFKQCAMKDTWRHEVYEIRFMNFVDLKKDVLCVSS